MTEYDFLNINNMERPIQTLPSLSGCPRVLVEGRPVAVLDGIPDMTLVDTTSDAENVPAALPRVLAGGQPVAIISTGQNGSVSVVGGP